MGGVWALRGGRGGRAVFLLRLPAQNENGTARRAAQISNKQNNPTIWGVPHYHYPPRMPPAALEKKWGYDIVTSLLRSSCVAPKSAMVTKISRNTRASLRASLRARGSGPMADPTRQGESVKFSRRYARAPWGVVLTSIDPGTGANYRLAAPRHKII